MGLSTDTVPSLRAWAASLGAVNYPLLADFHPKGAALQQLGLYNEQTGTALRAALIIDKEGVVRWKKLYERPDLPDPQEVLAELDKLRG